MGADKDTLSFEEALGRLEEIVGRLEEGELTLQETVTLYQTGRSLADHCQGLLDDVELQVQRLVREGQEPVLLADFDLAA